MRTFESVRAMVWIVLSDLGRYWILGAGGDKAPVRAQSGSESSPLMHRSLQWWMNPDAGNALCLTGFGRTGRRRADEKLEKFWARLNLVPRGILIPRATVFRTAIPALIRSGGDRSARPGQRQRLSRSGRSRCRGRPADRTTMGRFSGPFGRLGQPGPTLCEADHIRLIFFKIVAERWREPVGNGGGLGPREQDKEQEMGQQLQQDGDRQSGETSSGCRC